MPATPEVQNKPMTRPLAVDALPSTFRFDPLRTALLMIDMQRDFIEPGGFGASLGNDVARLAAICRPAARCWRPGATAAGG